MPCHVGEPVLRRLENLAKLCGRYGIEIGFKWYLVENTRENFKPADFKFPMQNIFNYPSGGCGTYNCKNHKIILNNVAGGQPELVLITMSM